MAGIASGIASEERYGKCLAEIALTCLRAIASLDSVGIMDW